MESFQGIYEDGIVRFPTPIALPDHTKVFVTADSVPKEIGTDSDEIYEILSRRYRSGHTDTAARVDEIDP